jgi:hypothetical protein
MRQHFWKPALLALSALAMTGLAPALVSAQDRPDDHHAMRADDHRDDHRDEHKDDRGGGDVERYSHDHPHSSARCHDGFFTATKDRNHACTKHGGIDVWLSL